MSNRQVVESYFQSLMSAVLTGDYRPLLGLFADNAHMLPGDGRMLRGKEAIAGFYGKPAPGFWITPSKMTEMGNDVRVDYEVGWLGLEEPVSGTDTFTIVEGKIAALRVGSDPS